MWYSTLMKKIAMYTFFALFLILSVHIQAEVITADAATKPTSTAQPLSTTSTVEPSTLPLAARQEKAYTELSSISARLTDITTRLEKALSQLAENNVDVSTITPLAEKAKQSLGIAETNLLVLAPVPQTLAIAETAPVAFSAKMAAPAPVVVPLTEAEVKTTVTDVEKNLKAAKQNLIDTLIALRAILSKNNTTQ